VENCVSKFSPFPPQEQTPVSITLTLAPDNILLLAGGEDSWTVDAPHRGHVQVNQTLCFVEQDRSEADGNDLIISTSSDSVTSKRVSITLMERTSKCGEEEMDPAKKMIGMSILALGIGTVLSVLGYLVKNQLEVCGDPRRNL